MRNVLMVAYHFPPLGGGGVQRAVRFARYLPESGYSVTVLTGPGGSDHFWTPADRSLLEGIERSSPVVRVTGVEPPQPGGVRRIAERLGTPSRFERWWVTEGLRAGVAAGSRSAAILGMLVPYESAVLVARLSRALRIPWIADLQDPWALDEMWMYPSAVQRVIDRRRMRRLLGEAAAIVMNTPEAVNRLVDAFPELEAKPVVSIPNGFDRRDFEGAVESRDDRAFRIVHAGYLHTQLGLRHRRTKRIRRLLGGMPIPSVDFLTRSHFYLLKAVESAARQEPQFSRTVEVHLAGALTEADRDVAQTSPHVRLLGYRSHEQTVALMRSADLLFLPMQDLPPGTRAGLVPGKTYEYLAAGRPILAAIPDGDAREILGAAGNALICRPADVDCLTANLLSAWRQWNQGEARPAPDSAVVARYECRAQVRELTTLIDSVVR